MRGHYRLTIDRRKTNFRSDDSRGCALDRGAATAAVLSVISARNRARLRVLFLERVLLLQAQMCLLVNCNDPCVGIGCDCRVAVQTDGLNAARLVIDATGELFVLVEGFESTHKPFRNAADEWARFYNAWSSHEPEADSCPGRKAPPLGQSVRGSRKTDHGWKEAAFRGWIIRLKRYRYTRARVSVRLPSGCRLQRARLRNTPYKWILLASLDERGRLLCLRGRFHGSLRVADLT